MKKFKCAVAGLGFVGVIHVEAVRRLGNVEVVAMCNRHDADEKAKALYIPQAFTDYREMIDANPDLDAVHICTTDEFHYEISKYALERGINVICEKPFTLEVEQARELSELAKEKGLKTQICFHYRMYPMIAEMREYIASGRLGRLCTVHGNYLQDWMLRDTDYGWRLEPGKSGVTRVTADIGTHWLDAAEYVAGQRIVEVMAEFYNIYPTRKKAKGKLETFTKVSRDAEFEDIENALEDTSIVMFKFESGAIGSCILSQSFSGYKNTVGLCVSGTESLVSWDTDRMCQLFIGNRDTANEVVAKDSVLLSGQAAHIADYPGGHDEGYPDGFKQLFKQFYADLEGAAQDSIYGTFEDGVHSVELTHAIYKSAVSRQWTKV